MYDLSCMVNLNFKISFTIVSFSNPYRTKGGQIIINDRYIRISGKPSKEITTDNPTPKDNPIIIKNILKFMPPLLKELKGFRNSDPSLFMYIPF